LDVARAQAAVARAAIVTEAERPKPSLNVPIEHRAEQHPWVVVPNLDVTIETAHKRGLRVQQATEAANVAELAIMQQAWQIRSSIRTQLATLHAAQTGIAALERQRTVQNDLVEALQRRVEAGESSRIELTTTRIAARQAELLRLDRLAFAAQARVRLATSIGIPESGLGTMRLRFDLALTEAPADLRERALLGRPDILVSLADYAAAESALQFEVARQYPDIHITPGFGWDAAVGRWDLGLTSLLPVLSRNRGPIGEAVARRALSESNFLALQARVIGAVDEAKAGYREALRKVRESAQVIDEQQRQVDAAQKSFDAGETDRVALRSAELELESARVAHADALVQAHAAWGALEDAIEQPLAGGGVSADIVTANPRSGWK
ncbi:MAG TPA: TolC family protein, partial [Thermoanaerobaculia bacterium]|nr:TolC family protein [Thermoanaerobaculia bacterium]